MTVCEKNLQAVSVDALIIQAAKDPIVNPISGKIIYDKISSSNKFLSEMNFSNHVVVNGVGKEEVFEEIRKFLSTIKLI